MEIDVEEESGTFTLKNPLYLFSLLLSISEYLSSKLEISDCLPKMVNDDIGRDRLRELGTSCRSLHERLLCEEEELRRRRQSLRLGLEYPYGPRLR